MIGRLRQGMSCATVPRWRRVVVRVGRECACLSEKSLGPGLGLVQGLVLLLVLWYLIPKVQPAVPSAERR